MSLTPDHILYRSEFHPQAPIQLIEFLKEELEVSHKYVGLVAGNGAEHLGRLWHKHLHQLAILEKDLHYFNYIEQVLKSDDRLWLSNQSMENTALDDDSIDTVILLNWPLDASEEALNIKTELCRVLRLNSYVLLLRHQLSTDQERTFGWAFSHFFKQYSSSSEHEYELKLTDPALETFYGDGFHQKSFSNQIRLNWEGLQAYYLSSEAALSLEDPNFKWAMKALRILFEQYQVDGEVVMDYQTLVYYGLFNQYVPAISLRKNIFFSLLRPFAFAFYILVKVNMYFWKSLYKLKPKSKS